MGEGHAITPRTSSRAGRLSRSAEFQRVYRQGRSHANRQLVLYVFPTPSGSGSRLGLSVSRKVGGAVERNRVKRLLREAFAEVLPELHDGHDVVLVARPSALELADRDGLDGVRASVSELLSKAGLSTAGPPQQTVAGDGLQGQLEGIAGAPGGDPLAGEEEP